MGLETIRSKMALRHALILSLSGALILALLLPVFPAFSQDGSAARHSLPILLRSTRDEGILHAFRQMENSQGEASLSKIVNKPMRVIFKDMKTLNKSLKNYDALSWISYQGEQVIFINEKHRNAPPEALAAMIAHEAMHDDEFNSVNEEVAGWTFEAQVWIEMKARNPQLTLIPPGTSALVDRENKIEDQYRQGNLAAFVRGNPGYHGLPETSPGFIAANTSAQVQYRADGGRT
jgi:hypothetical protein